LILGCMNEPRSCPRLSRAQCNAQRCIADPGPRFLAFVSKRGSRIGGASFLFAPCCTASGTRGRVMEWVNAILQGILLGGLYAMFAAGLSLIFGVMRLVNIAHGDLIVLSAYIALVTVQ